MSTAITTALLEKTASFLWKKTLSLAVAYKDKVILLHHLVKRISYYGLIVVHFPISIFTLDTGRLFQDP
jgi:hypothetical protein